MKKHISILLILATQIIYAQNIRFNSELDKYCKNSLKEFSAITPERKLILDGIAKQLSQKKYIVFTCQTNSRRTQLLQVWAQTSFTYFGLYNRQAFSIGDTVTYVYSEVANVLKESGFSYINLENASPNGFIISISKEYPVNMLSSKKDLGTIDTAKVALVNICYDKEKSNYENMANAKLPYQSPVEFEKTPQEKEKYTALNQQIVREMLYLAQTTKVLIMKNEDNSD